MRKIDIFIWSWKVLVGFHLTLLCDNNAQNLNLSDFDAPSGPVFSHFF